jgi:phospholipid/cholesterol/gamma-HCH transport system substrate-binding protein
MPAIPRPSIRQVRVIVAAGISVLLVAGIVYLVARPSAKTNTIVAQFTEAPGLYPGNHVEEVGIPVGTVTGVKPEDDYVLVTLKIDAKYKIAAGAVAELMAPEVVSDRFVQLEPPYTGGPAMPHNAVIPPQRTIVPQSVDQIVGSLNALAEELGPNGINKDGALTALVHRLAVQFGGNGPNFNKAVVNLSTVVQGLSQNAPQVASLLNNVGSLSTALANNSNTYAQLTSNLASVSQVLANDRSQVGSVLSSLQQLFSNLTAFIQADGGKLGSSITNLDTFAAALGSQQAVLAQAFDLAPLALQNLDQAIDKTAPGGPALEGRYDPVSATTTLFNQVCGNATLRFLVVLATGTETNPLTVGTPTDTICAVGNALTALTPPPGSSPGPDLTLAALAQ